MTFRRVNILQRLFAICDTIPGVKNVTWDVISINDDQLPALAVLEGDEETNEDDPVNRPPSAPRRVTMMPHIVIAGRRNLQGSPPADIGENLNAIYAALLKAIMTDATLAGLTLDGRGVRFLGMESDLAVGRMMQGQMAVKFAFTYGLVLTDL